MITVIFAVICGLVSLSCVGIAGTMAIKGKDMDAWMPFLIGAGVSLFLFGLFYSDASGR